MRVELINKNGGKTSVDDSKVAEYLEAGFKLASDNSVKVEPKEEKAVVKPRRTVKKK